MKLYMHPAACSLSPHIVMRELGLPVELVAVDRKTHRTADGRDYLAINGNGYVPVLGLEDGSTIMEGPAIVQFLADQRPEAGLLPPPGSGERLRVQIWLNFITSELHKPMAMLFSPAYAPAGTALQLVTQLAGSFLTGERFTVADAYLFVCLNWSPWLGIDLVRWPALAAFVRRVAQRPKVQEALAAEDLVPRDRTGIFFAPRAMVAEEVRP